MKSIVDGRTLEPPSITILRLRILLSLRDNTIIRTSPRRTLRSTNNRVIQPVRILGVSRQIREQGSTLDELALVVGKSPVGDSAVAGCDTILNQMPVSGCCVQVVVYPICGGLGGGEVLTITSRLSEVRRQPSDDVSVQLLRKASWMVLRREQRGGDSVGARVVSSWPPEHPPGHSLLITGSLIKSKLMLLRMIVRCIQ